MAAANDNHNPGTARFPVSWISHVQIAGVKPPNTAVARLKAIENPAARTVAGIISARNGTMAPLYPPNRTESHSSTSSSLVNEGALTSQRSEGYAVTSESTEKAISS